MEKSTKIMLGVVAFLSALIIVIFVSPGAREFIINGANHTIFKPAMVTWLNFVDWLDCVRGVYLLGSGLVGGLILAIIITQIAVPKIRHKTMPTLAKLNVQREPAEPEPAPVRTPTAIEQPSLVVEESEVTT